MSVKDIYLLICRLEGQFLVASTRAGETFPLPYIFKIDHLLGGNNYERV